MLLRIGRITNTGEAGEARNLKVHLHPDSPLRVLAVPQLCAEEEVKASLLQAYGIDTSTPCALMKEGDEVIIQLPSKYEVPLCPLTLPDDNTARTWSPARTFQSETFLN